MRAVLQTDEIRIDSFLSEADARSLTNDVLDGLTRPFKSSPPSTSTTAAVRSCLSGSVSGPSTTRRVPSCRSCSVMVGELGLRVPFAAGEELRTEISAKFTRGGIQADLEAAGLGLSEWYTDDQQLAALSVPPRADSDVEVETVRRSVG
jgi:uncharacterized SAM-dependent methyltransferase